MLSEVDRKVLMIQFQCDPNASDENIRKIAMILGVPFPTVQTFFQNQRKFAKMRRAKRKEVQVQEKIRVEKAKEIYFKDLERIKNQNVCQNQNVRQNQNVQQDQNVRQSQNVRQNSQGEFSQASSATSMASSNRSSHRTSPKSSYNRFKPVQDSVADRTEDLTKRFKRMDTVDETFQDPAIVATVKTSTPERSNSLRDRVRYRQDVKAFKIMNEFSCIKPSTPLKNMKKVAEESLRIKKPSGYGKQGNRRTLFGFI